MKLSRKFDCVLVALAVLSACLTFFSMSSNQHLKTYAEGEESEIYEEKDTYFVTIFDGSNKLTIKTAPKTVAEILEKLNIVIDQTDSVEPSLETTVNADNFFINIYRSHPAIVKDGSKEKYIMTSSYNPKTIVENAGITVYDDDDIKLIPNHNFLESGIASVYEIVRNGSHILTVEEEIGFGEQIVKDYSMAYGTSEVRTLGEVGRKTVTIDVEYKDNVEVSRTVISEEVIKAPVDRVVATGAKKSIPPEWETCANWAREAGVSEDDLSIALDIIYRESGCRIDAENYSTGAYGIPQALPAEKLASAGADWRTNPVTQIRWMIGYVNGRYGGWQGAAAWREIHHWY